MKIDKNVLVTGSNGFTGKTLINVLKRKHYKVFNLDCDITKKNELDYFIKNIEPNFIIHLAAISDVQFSDTDAIYNVNVEGTKNLLSSVSNMEKLPELVVIPSTAYVYGVPEIDFLNENSKIAPSNDYGKSKLKVEEICKTFQKFPILITRPFNYTGVDQGLNFIIPKIIHHFKLEKKEIELGNINAKREFNDVRDVCDIYIKFLENVKNSSTVNICSGKSYSIENIIEICKKLTGHNINIKINERLKRKKDVDNIVGDPKKMYSIIGNHSFHKLENTIQFMLRN